MRFPIDFALSNAKHMVQQRSKGRKRYPTVLMLEPLYTCNLACIGCSVERHTGKLKDRLPLEKCLGIVALSWIHGEPFPDARTAQHILEILHGRGIAVHFKEPVLWQPFTGTDQPGPTALAELQIPILSPSGLGHWENLPAMAYPIKDPVVDGDHFLASWELDQSVRVAPGFCLIVDQKLSPEITVDPARPFRLVLYADFVINEKGVAVDGNFIGGKLPTGASGGGGTFRSWFTLPQRRVVG